MNSLLMQESPQREGVYSKEELSYLDPERVPRHVALIMDGNRRWAKQHRLPYIAGHWKGADTLTRIVRAASELGIKVLTVYSFSTENWNRLPEEVAALMELIEAKLMSEKESMVKDGVKLDTIGDLSRLPDSVKKTLNEVKKATEQCSKIELVLALNYGGRDDICRAVKAIAEECVRGELPVEGVSEQTISRHLDTAKWGDPSLLVRTSGEMRISNFLIWQISYSEVYVTEELWPEFSERSLLRALVDYQKRRRRFGE